MKKHIYNKPELQLSLLAVETTILAGSETPSQVVGISSQNSTTGNYARGTGGDLWGTPAQDDNQDNSGSGTATTW